MPNASPQEISWSSEDFEKLINLVKGYPCLYHEQDPSRKNILEKESSWEHISQEIGKPVEECKKRWRTIKDGYMKAIRTENTGNKARVIGLFRKLEFLKDVQDIPEDVETVDREDLQSKLEVTEDQEQVIMDNQEYYEITLVDENATQEPTKTYAPRIQITKSETLAPPKKIRKCGRKRYMPPPNPNNLAPIKILPKPIMMNGVKIIQQIEEPKVITQAPRPVNIQRTEKPERSDVLDSLIEKVLKEHTNEIDVFFRSMAASVKKLQPNLIPKVKMEVCNVIAKYELQSFDKNC